MDHVQYVIRHGKSRSTKLTKVYQMYNSLQDIPSETLQAELRKHGYNLAKQQEKLTTGEIVKIR